MTTIDQIIRECFDISDNYTRKFILGLDEAEQTQLLDTLSNALYEKIVGKVEEIDFGTIPKSRGDITKVDGYANTMECLNIIRKLILEYKQDPAFVDVVLAAASNVKERTGVFMKGYNNNVELPMMMYNLIVLSIERSVSLMIATCIEYVKDTANNTSKMALDAAAYQNVLEDVIYKQVISFNAICETGEFDKLMDASIKNNLKIRKEDIDLAFEDPVPNDQPTGYESDAMEPDFTTTPEKDEATASLFGEPCACPAGADDCEECEPEDDDNTIPVDPVAEVPAGMDEEPEDNDEDESPVMFGSFFTNDNDVNDQAETIPPVTTPVRPDDGVTQDDPDAVLVNEKDPQNESVAITIATGLGAIAAFGAGAKFIYTLTIKWLIPFLRNTVYNFYYSIFKFSEYLDIQAQLIDANANELEYSSDGNDQHTQKVVQRQRKWADSLRKLSNKFSLDKKKSSNLANKEIEKEEKEKGKVEKNQSGDDVLFFKARA